jgi:hypothetical protein
LGKTSGSTQGRNPRHHQIGGVIFQRTSHHEFQPHMAHERVAIEFNALAGQAFYWRHRKIAASEKRAGRAGNRHGCDLGVRLTKPKRRTNYELKSR